MIEFLFSSQITEWYASHKRDLPWRSTDNPYHIWLSEIILQQTRIEQGLPYFLAFIKKYETVNDLANAPIDEVLRLWQGLGYYSRARNLQFAAQQVVNDYNGKFPDTYEELLKLKGVGQYTAAAIASFAFHEDVAVLDGNVYRVLARYFGIENDISENSSKKIFTDLANKALPKGSSYIHNQAIMEFGSLQCKPGMPNCNQCVLKDSCYSYKHNLQTVLPKKSKKVKMKKLYFNYVVLEKGGDFFLNQRLEKDIWQGLYDFILIESDNLLDVDALMENEKFQELSLKNPRIILESKSYKHILSHRIIFAKFWHIKTSDSDLENNFFTIEEIQNLPKPILINNFLKDYIF